ncbi:hypothetical protein B4N89_45355 [Embleya scabrispora]|uniref:Uncharacterized protein n=1 Tax=Embleya scabrispora TaxID=159449 RepID=A0A1T3NIP5_9ACTN|nr:hypothetical protein [Embleya scabrispora]OPC76717.1 hypothetical protein B4N89_45355 [Embleya scabrispora]
MNDKHVEAADLLLLLCGAQPHPELTPARRVRWAARIGSVWLSHEARVTEGLPPLESAEDLLVLGEFVDATTAFRRLYRSAWGYEEWKQATPVALRTARAIRTRRPDLRGLANGVHALCNGPTFPAHGTFVSAVTRAAVHGRRYEDTVAELTLARLCFRADPAVALDYARNRPSKRWVALVARASESAPTRPQPALVLS